MFGISKETKIHFVGIGGIGMSGIAEVLLNLGYEVSGSDISESANVVKLKRLGAKIFIGHKKENVDGATIVVYSSAINKNNPEFNEAQQLKLPLIRRAEMLAELMRLKFGIAIAGTHGKTTTTSFLATILHEAGLDPSHIIGGIVRHFDGHAKLGREKFFIAEADESDGSFLLLNPVMSIVTNIDNDHLDYYQTEENLINAFREFIHKVPFYGKVALNAHDANLRGIIEDIKKPYVTFGIDDEEFNINVDYMAFNIFYGPDYAEFSLKNKEKSYNGFKIHIPGRHNILNALGAIAIASEIGVDLNDIKKFIQKFSGVGRRVEKLYQNKDFIIIDDYGHHPTEISATLNGLKESYPNFKLRVVFEPHRYSRTKDCWNGFLNCFNAADEVYISPIYAASENKMEDISSKNLVRDINRLHPKLATYIENLDELNSIVNARADKEIVVSLGAGSIGKKIRNFIETL